MKRSTMIVLAVVGGLLALRSGAKAAPAPKGGAAGGLFSDEGSPLQRKILRDDAITVDGAILLQDTVSPGTADLPASGDVQWSDGKVQTYSMPSANPSQWNPMGALR